MKQGKVLNSFLQLIKKLLLLFVKYKFKKTSSFQSTIHAEYTA